MYQPPCSERYLILIPKGWTKQKSGGVKDAWKWLQNNYPGVASHLKPFSEKAQKRYDKGEYWWELRACEYYDAFESPKIIYPNICKRPEFAFDELKKYTNQKCFIIPLTDKYLLGILNSSVNFFLFRTILPKLRGDFYEPSYVFLKDFPIHTIDFSNPADKAQHDKLVALVDNMLELQKKYHEARMERDKELYERQIKFIDEQIDRLVYDLYGLTEGEIGVVEENR
jgi:hypothetical protein